MPFVYERRSRVLKPIAIRRIRAHGHKDDRMVAAEAEVHALLQARAFALAHFDVGDDVVTHRCFIAPNLN